MDFDKIFIQCHRATCRTCISSHFVEKKIGLKLWEKDRNLIESSWENLKLWCKVDGEEVVFIEK